MISEFSTMRQYDEHVQARRRSYQDAQYDLKMLINLAEEVRHRVWSLFGWTSPRAARQLSADRIQLQPEQREFTRALNAGLSRSLERC